MAQKKSTLIEVTTQSGFKCKVNPEAMDDMRLVESITVLKKDGDLFEKTEAVFQLLILMIGEEQKAKLYEHVAEKENGRVPLKAFEREVADIFEAMKDSKKK
ncbi:MAG: hypothetical protein MJ086_03400 [Lachnospiraceae bacterium]|nr:hypothetical protein [Lachnospiraceae bacterium]